MPIPLRLFRLLMVPGQGSLELGPRNARFGVLEAEAGRTVEQFKLELRRALEFVRQSEHLVQSHTRPEDPVLFLPDDAALYFLADRPHSLRSLFHDGR